MTTQNISLETKINNSFEMFMLAAKECGFTAPEQVEENFQLIAMVASEMVKESRERILTKLSSDPTLLYYLAARYKKRVLES